MNKAKKTKRAAANGAANGARAVPPPLVFSVRNLGNIQSGQFTHKPLTIFCGPNNSGKTWVMYSLYSFYNLSSDSTIGVTELPSSETGRMKIRKIMVRNKLDYNRVLSHQLHIDFNAPRENLKGVEFSCNLTQNEWIKFVRKRKDLHAFLIPAERNGLHLFYRELSTRRTALLHHVSKENMDINELLKDVIRSRYAKPIADYINWLNNLTLQQKDSEEFHSEALLLQKQLASGRYQLNRVTGDITFHPYQKRKGIPAKILGIHSASSTVKSLFGLWFYLEHEAKRGDVLMIDEPELNLHPQNQLLITHMLSRLVNMGINVVISTHSDYIVHEINNLMLLHENDAMLKTANRINKGKITYKREALLSAEKVGVYSVDNNTITPFKYEKTEGFSDSAFEDVIYRHNRTMVELYNSVDE